jgi:asparaginyl-tRNA synthetase
MVNVPKTPEGNVDWSQDFFGQQSFLTVSGQLHGEAMACGLGQIYTFGPTFRAENSHTSRHLAEFWMIEPELAFCNFEDIQQLAEDMLKFVARGVLEHCEEDMAFFAKRIEPEAITRLQHIADSGFLRMTYTDAVDILEKSGQNFEFPVSWGVDLSSEHERFITETYLKQPVILTDYPEEIKSFYMRRNDDQKTVSAMDVLVPGLGEIIGGSQREERLDILDAKMEKLGIKEELWWYRDLRRFGTVPHGGFGLGFERLLSYITGMENVRDTIPFPRTPGSAKF